MEANYIEGIRYDMIFMDMNMNDYDGRAGINMIRLFEKRNKIVKPTAICAVSGDDFGDNTDLASLGVVFKLKKPITLPILRLILKKTVK